MIDPQAKAVHDLMNDGRPLDRVGVEGARLLSAQFTPPPPSPDERLVIADRQLANVPVRVYRPAGQTESATLVYLHSGGWVMGDLDNTDPICRALALAGDIAVISVDYRLSPEAQYPLPLDDCVNVLRWVGEEGIDDGFDPARVCVAGESSGGQLAAATCLRARNLGLPVAFQLLVNPAIDPGMDSRSWQELGGDWLPVASQMSWMWDLYAGSSAVREREPLVNLALEQDLAGLPPTLILTSEYDPLRDEGEQYGQRLAQAGVPTELRRLAGQVHAAFTWAGTVNACRTALHEAVATVVKHLGPGSRQNTS
jgi:acetyl esterase